MVSNDFGFPTRGYGDPLACEREVESGAKLLRI